MKTVPWIGLVLLIPASALAKDSLSRPEISAAPKTTQVIAGPPISLQPPPPPDLQAVSATSKVALNAQASSLSASLFSNTISFNFPVGTAIGNQYQNEGIIFGGSGAHIIQDGSSPNSPVLSGTPDFDGDITGQFVEPGTSNLLPVFMMIFDIGGFDEVGAVRMEFFDPEGNALFDFVNDRPNFVRYAVRGGNKGIGSWRFSNIPGEPDGFGIDDVAFTTPGLSDLGSEMGITACSLGNPVNPAVGNKYQIESKWPPAVLSLYTA